MDMESFFFKNLLRWIWIYHNGFCDFIKSTGRLICARQVAVVGDEMSQSGYRVVRSNKDFGVLGDLGDLGDLRQAKITQVNTTWN